MAEDSDQLHKEGLRRVLAVARQLSATDDLKQILSVIIDAMRDVLEAERATVFEYDGEANELFSTVAHGISGAGDDENAGSGEIRFSASTGLAGECVCTRKIINIPDAYADRRFNPQIDAETGFRTKSLLTMPLIGHDGELIGVAQVLNRRSDAFTEHDEEIASALASQAAVALKRGRLIEDRIMRLKLERDLELAKKIQTSGFPDELPTVGGYDFAAWSDPADQTGGDTYDLIGLNDEEDSTVRVFFLLGDATGHGVGPGLAVTQVRSMLRMAVRLGTDLEQAVSEMNRQLCQDLPGGHFVTAWFGELDVAANVLRSFSAAQAPLLRYIASECRTVELGSDVMPLGIFADLPAAPYNRLPLEPGDIFAAISDGIFEQTNDQDEEFGSRRVGEIISELHSVTPDEIAAAIRDCVDKFCGDEPVKDDRTVIIIKRSEV